MADFYVQGYIIWKQTTVYLGSAQGKRLLAQLQAQGIPELYTSCGLGEASPEDFYKQLGFTPTGEMYGDEIELKLNLNQVA